METVSMRRRFDAAPERVRALVTDAERFMRAAGFDRVERDGERLRIENDVGLLSIELDLEIVDRPGAVLAYEQRDGIFEAMVTWYELSGADGGAELAATTEFALDVALVGMVLDATVIKRQRRKELSAQFDYLDAEL